MRIPRHAPAPLSLFLCLLLAAAACDAGDPTIDEDPDGGGDLPPGEEGDEDDPGEDDDEPGSGAGVVPSNAAAVGLLEETGLVVAPPAGSFDTSLGCSTPSSLGACEPVAVPGGVELCVCRMDELTVGDLVVTGARGLVILAHRHVTVTGVLSVAGRGAEDGPGALLRYPEADNGYLSGAAGGSYGTRGGRAAGMPFGTDELMPLVGGMRGQDGCTAAGGGAGGALQVTAGEAIYLHGAISASGAGGRGGRGSCLGGAGGGSGGAVLLEAPTVQVVGAVAANGGGGGGGGSNDHGAGGSGSPGALTGDPAPGGAGESGHGCPLYGYTAGGWGGNGATASTPAGDGGGSDSVSCLNGTAWLGQGGGGGGMGRIRVNTATGCMCSGMFSPAPSMGALEIR